MLDTISCYHSVYYDETHLYLQAYLEMAYYGIIKYAISKYGIAP